jgi:hypothetical protein
MLHHVPILHNGEVMKRDECFSEGNERRYGRNEGAFSSVDELEECRH